MKKFVGTLVGTSTLALSCPAFAQEAAGQGASAEQTMGEDIIVSARRRDESIQDVPLSVQAVTSEQLQKLEIRSFQDIAKVVPGLSLASQGFATSASLRGITFDGRASGSSTSVEFYRNDAVITSNALFAAVYDIGQIEVLRGPQGTLRGRASPSGSITITTRRPDLSGLGGYASGSVANRSKWNIEGALNLPVITDKLAIRVAGYKGDNRGNNVRGLNVPTGAIDDDIFARTEALRASLRADPFDGVLVLDFNFETIHVERQQYEQSQSLANFSGSKLAGVQSPRTISPAARLGIGSVPTTQDNHYKIYNWQAKFRQWGQALTYVGNRLVGEQLIYGQQDAGGILPMNVAAFPFVNPPAGLEFARFGQLTNSPVRQTVHELRLQNEDRVAGLFDYVIGGFTAQAGPGTLIYTGSAASYRSATPGSATVPVAGGVPASPVAVSPGTAFPNGLFPSYRLNYLAFSATNRPRYEKESSLFGNLTVHLGEATELSGGLRHIWWKGDSGTASGISLLDPRNSGGFIQRACFGEKVLPDLNSATLGANYVCAPTKEATIYMASLKHKFSEDFMAYASFGTSWRPGNSLVGWGLSQGLAPTYGAQVNRFLNLPDETSKSFEVGFKTAWLDRRLTFNLSAFYQKFNNFPIYPNNAVSLSTPNGSTPAPSLVNNFVFAAPAPVTVKGVEADLAFKVSDNFNLSATFAFADSKASNATVPCNDLNNDNVQDGTTPTLSQLQAHLPAGAQIDTCTLNAAATTNARFSGTVQAEYTVPVSERANGYLRGFINWRGSSANDPTNPIDAVPAYAVVDLFAGLRGSNGAWEAGFYVKNLLDKQVVTRRDAAPGLTAIATAPTSPGNTVAGNAGYNYLGIATNDPREFGLSLRYAFGSR
jgi:iron complex outermembrane recepter protein